MLPAISTNLVRFPHLSLNSPSQILRNLNAIALPAIALVGVAHVQAAEAGFGFFAACMGICTSATGGTLIPACVAACVASLAAPTP